LGRVDTRTAARRKPKLILIAEGPTSRGTDDVPLARDGAISTVRHGEHR
jgi:hypothetical protein